MDPAVIAGPVTSTNLMVIVLSLIGTIVSTAAMLWKTTRDQKFTLDKAEREQKHTENMMALRQQLEWSDRQAKADAAIAAAEIAAAKVRERMVTDAAALQSTVHATSLRVADKLGEQERTVKAQLDLQTETVSKQIEAAAIVAKQDTNSVLTEKAAVLHQVLDTSTTAQSKALIEVIEAAKHFTADEARAAYHEANSVNIKLEKANKRIEELYEILVKLMEAVTPKTGDSGAGVDEAHAAVAEAKAQVNNVKPSTGGEAT